MAREHKESIMKWLKRENKEEFRKKTLSSLRKFRNWNKNTGDRKDIRNRLYSKNDKQHFGALLELFIVDIFSNLSNCKYQPCVLNQHSKPDGELIHIPSNSKTIIEAKIVSDTQVGKEEENLKIVSYLLQKSFLRIPKSYSYVLDVLNTKQINRNPSQKQLAQRIENWLKLSPTKGDEISLDYFTLKVSKLDSIKPGVILGGIISNVVYSNAREQLKESIKSKLSQHRLLNDRLLLVFRISSFDGVDNNDIEAALFGTECCEQDIFGKITKHYRRNDGIFADKNISESLQGIVFIDSLFCWYNSPYISLWLNPNISKPDWFSEWIFDIHLLNPSGE